VKKYNNNLSFFQGVERGKKDEGTNIKLDKLAK
jgi:hypothetical protein